MQKKNCCPFSYDPKEAQTQILVILLQIRSTLSTWVEMKIKLVLHVSPLLITPHDKAQGLFLITLDVKPAVLCAGGLMKAASLQFEIPPPSSSPLQNVVQSHNFFPAVPARSPWTRHPPPPFQTRTTHVMGATDPSLIIHSTIHSMRITENIWNLEKSSLKTISVQILRRSNVFLRKNCNYWVLNFLSLETTIEIILVLFSGCNFHKTFQCVKIFLLQCVNLE